MSKKKTKKKKPANVKRGRASKSKGKRGERMLAKELNRLFNVEARRGQQYSGEQGAADVVDVPGLFIECKNIEALNVREALKLAKDQAPRCQAYADRVIEHPVPVVCWKKNNQPWTITLNLEDLPSLVEMLSEVMWDQEISDDQA